MTGSDASGRAPAAVGGEQKSTLNLRCSRGWDRRTAVATVTRSGEGPLREGHVRRGEWAPRHWGPPAYLSLFLLSEKTAG